MNKVSPKLRKFRDFLPAMLESPQKPVTSTAFNDEADTLAAFSCSEGVAEQSSPTTSGSKQETNLAAETHIQRPTLRAFPFPFRAALAINNDTDGMDWASFEAYHAFLNGDQETSYGTGLGLEVGDSFWIYSDLNEFSLRHSGPWDHDAAPTPEAARIKELAQAGWLDTLHSIGDWAPGYQLTRKDIAHSLQILDDLDAEIPIHVNHGGGDLRFHNIGGPWFAYQSGDDPTHEAYLLAPLLKRGFRFFWIDTLYELRKFGEQLRGEVADTALKGYRFNRWQTVRLMNTYQERGMSRRVLGENTIASEEAQFCIKMASDLLFPAIGRDDAPFYAFKRFRGEEAPNAASFALQATDAHLDQLEAGHGAVIIYQHFGVWRGIGRNKMHASQIAGRSSILDENAIWTFRALKERQDAGRLLVTTTGKLLTYLRMRDNLVYDVEANSDGGWTVILKGVSCPVFGFERLTPDNINGLAFLVNSACGPVDIRLSGYSGRVHTRREQDPVRTETDVVYIPWQRLSWLFPTHSPTPVATRQYAVRVPTEMQRQAVASHTPLSPESLNRFKDLIMSAAQEGAILEKRKDLGWVQENWHKLPFPKEFGPAVKNAEKVHNFSFNAYLNRINRLTDGGKLALDAGSGTATWCFALAQYFDQVIGIDRTRSRVDLGKWLISKAGTNRIRSEYGDVTDINLPSGEVDFIFCNGVIISSAVNLRQTLREFYRVLKPGGVAYVCLNGWGWSLYLRDERGEKSRSDREAGIRGLYNSYLAEQQADLNERLSSLRSAIAVSDDMLKAAERAANLNGLRRYLEALWDVPAKDIANVQFQGAKNWPQPMRVAEAMDAMLSAAKIEGQSVVNTLNILNRECGESYGEQFGIDLLRLLAGTHGMFSHSTAGRAYAPEEVGKVASDAGFEDFRSGGEAELIGYSGIDVSAPAFFGAQFQKHLKVWEFLVRRPISS